MAKVWFASGQQRCALTTACKRCSGKLACACSGVSAEGDASSPQHYFKLRSLDSAPPVATGATPTLPGALATHDTQTPPSREWAMYQSAADSDFAYQVWCALVQVDPYTRVSLNLLPAMPHLIVCWLCARSLPTFK